MKKNLIYGIHPVNEALQTGKSVDKILVKQGISNPVAASILKTARATGINVQYVPVEKLDKITGKNHQGILAFLSEIEYTDLSLLVPQLYEKGRNPFILILDGITDVRNFGAIARSAEGAGTDAIVIPSKESVSVNSDAMKTSAGALNNIPVCKTSDLYKTTLFLKESGLQIIGAQEKASDVYFKADFTNPTALVLGAEDTGISPRLLGVCDTIVNIPMFGTINSLNVSAAASIIMYEMVRQRNF